VNSNNDMNSDGNYQPSRIVYSQSFVPGDSSTSDAYGMARTSRIIAGNAYDSQPRATIPASTAHCP